MGHAPPARSARQSQDVLAAILAQSRDCIKLVNLAGELQYINPNGAAALGLPDPGAVLGRNWIELWPAEARSRIEDAVAAAREGGNLRFEAFCPTFTGEPRWWDVAVSPTHDKAGKVTHILATSRDVSELVAARLRESERREAAQRQAQVASEIAREMRHRLKNQLAVVGAVANLLARHTADARALAGKLEEKLAALARAQDLLSVRREKPAAAAQAIRQILSASPVGERVALSEIPDASLPDESVQQLALLLGELETNALKHGALRSEGGRAELSGRREGGVLTLCWREEGELPVEPVEKGSGGFQLIRRLGAAGAARPSIGWSAKGIEVEFHLRALD